MGSKFLGLWLVKFVQESEILKKIGEMVDQYVVEPIKKIIDTGKKVCNYLVAWVDRIREIIGSISLTDMFSLGVSKFEDIIKKIRGFVRRLYDAIVNSETFKKIRNFIYKYLIEPFQRIQNLINSIIRKINNNPLIKKISDYISDSFGNVKEGLGKSKQEFTTSINLYNKSNQELDYTQLTPQARKINLKTD